MLHELGHVLGLEHAASGLMASTLAPGVRLRPSPASLRHAPRTARRTVAKHRRHGREWRSRARRS
jgi:hypothetical protein